MFNLRKILFLPLFFLLFSPFAVNVAAQENEVELNSVDLYLFQGQGCSYCAKMKGYLEGLKTDYPNLKVYDFEVYFDEENQLLYQKMAEVYGVQASGVPAIFIGEEVIIGEDFAKVKSAIEKCSREVICSSPGDRIGDFKSGEDSQGGEGTSGNFDNYETVGWIVLLVIIIGGVTFIFYAKKKNV